MRGDALKRSLILCLVVAFVFGPGEIAWANGVLTARLRQGEPSPLYRLFAAVDGYLCPPVYALDAEHAPPPAERGRADRACLAQQEYPEVGGYYLRARYYRTGSGRFLSEDYVDNDGLSYHKYLYGRGNPVNGLDPNGLFTLLELVVVIAVIAVLAALIRGGIYAYQSYKRRNPTASLGDLKIKGVNNSNRDAPGRVSLNVTFTAISSSASVVFSAGDVFISRVVYRPHSGAVGPAAAMNDTDMTDDVLRNHKFPNLNFVETPGVATVNLTADLAGPFNGLLTFTPSEGAVLIDAGTVTKTGLNPSSVDSRDMSPPETIMIVA